MALARLQEPVLDHELESPRDVVAATKIQYPEKLVGRVIFTDPRLPVPVKLPHCINILLKADYNNTIN